MFKILGRNKSHRKLKIVHAPLNTAGMPGLMAKAFRDREHQAEQVQYHYCEPSRFGFDMDVDVNFKENGGRVKAQGATLVRYLDDSFDIFYFWHRSFIDGKHLSDLSGFDLPLIKARDARIAYRFTGYDGRIPSIDKKVNPYSPFHYGFDPPVPEDIQRRYNDYIVEYVDQFVVQDPEMAQFAPSGTKILPRGLDLAQWIEHPPLPTDRPLIVHASSDDLIKGTKFVLAAVERLHDEGLKFDFKLIQGMQHAEARKYYEKADIIVDPLLIGATGVLTLEAWALGKPCVVNLRRDLFEPFYKTKDLPVGNANPDTVEEVLRMLITDADLRADLGRRGRALIEKWTPPKTGIFLTRTTKLSNEFNGSISRTWSFRRRPSFTIFVW